MTSGQDPQLNDLSQGMPVETTGESLGESDLTKPTVEDVVQGDDGQVKGVVVEKGAIFKKRVEVPTDRILEVDRPSSDPGTGRVVIDASAEEEDSLSASGEDALPPLADGPPQPPAQTSDAQADEEHVSVANILGPGLLNGMASSDPSAVTTMAVAGARSGYSYLWLMFLMLPMLQSCEYASAKIGRTTHTGLAGVLRKHYSTWSAGLVGGALILGNLALVAADLVAIGSGLELITGLGWIWFIAPVAVGLWYVTVYANFDSLKKIFIPLGLVFVTYLVTAVLARPDWGKVLSGTFVPHLDFSFASISAAVALLGAGISPYQLIWQASGEREEKRPGPPRQQAHFAAIDVLSGVASNTIVSYSIIVATAATLFAKHQQVKSAVDAAKSLEPLVGPFAKYLFAVGLIGAGLIAIPVLLASTSYTVAETFGWPSSLSKKPWQNEGFYLILTGAMIMGLALAALGFDPIELIFWSNIVQGVLAPVLVILLLVMGNSRKVMHDMKLGVWTNLGLGLAAVLTVAATLLFFYGLATGSE